MGKQQSKEKKKEGEEEEGTKINDKRMIYIDEFGNFIVGKSPAPSVVEDPIELNTLIGDKLFDPDEEALQIMETDDLTEEVVLLLPLDSHLDSFPLTLAGWQGVVYHQYRMDECVAHVLPFK